VDLEGWEGKARRPIAFLEENALETIAREDS
jgi:hypothetical protein